MQQVQVVINLPTACSSRGRQRLLRQIKLSTIFWLVLLGIVTCLLQRNLQQAVLMDQIINSLDQYQVNPFFSPSPIQEDPAEESFSNLELLVSVFPGKPHGFGGFVELQESIIKSAQFFWPVDKFKMTVVLDDNVCDNTPSAQANMSSKVRSLFRPDFASKVNVQYNPLSNQTIYGGGWWIQQLIMLWADNFTDAEYIGFVDDDTIISRVVHASELFDELGRPRAIVRHMFQAAQSTYALINYYAFQRPTLVYAMTYFPVIIKRDHLKLMRQTILEAHPEFSYFDEFFMSLRNTTFSQFCMMMDYCFFHHKDSYSWHFEESLKGWGKTGDPTEVKYRDRLIGMQQRGEIYAPSKRAELGVTDEMLTIPFPRVAVHGSYLVKVFHYKRFLWSRTKEGRRHFVSKIFKEGYCFSLPNRTMGTQEAARCAALRNDNKNINERGEWRFEYIDSIWLESNRTAVSQAHFQAMARNVEHDWDEKELEILFSS